MDNIAGGRLEKYQVATRGPVVFAHCMYFIISIISDSIYAHIYEYTSCYMLYATCYMLYTRCSVGNTLGALGGKQGDEKCPVTKALVRSITSHNANPHIRVLSDQA